jgi:flagellar biosynthesis/type III secretory pathway ATPase
VGAYKAGADRLVDAALAHRQEMLGFLIQRPEEADSFEGARTRLIELARRLAAHQLGRAA